MQKNDSKFITYLSNHTELDYKVIDELFVKNEDSFHVAQVLIDRHGIDSHFLGKIWGDYLGYAYVDPNSTIVNQDYINLLGLDFIKANHAIPLYKFGKAVTVSTAHPTSPFLQDKLEKKLKEIVSLVFCFPFDIDVYLRLNNLK